MTIVTGPSDETFLSGELNPIDFHKETLEKLPTEAENAHQSMLLVSVKYSEPKRESDDGMYEIKVLPFPILTTIHITQGTDPYLHFNGEDVHDYLDYTLIAGNKNEREMESTPLPDSRSGFLTNRYCSGMISIDDSQCDIPILFPDIPANLFENEELTHILSIAIHQATEKLRMNRGITYEHALERFFSNEAAIQNLKKVVLTFLARSRHTGFGIKVQDN